MTSTRSSQRAPLASSTVRTFANTATTTASGPGNTPVSDISQDGSDPDPDHNGDPGDNSAPTPVVLPPLRAQIGLAKRVATSSYDPASGQLHVTFAFVVANPGNVDLSNVQVVDDLATAFAGAASVHVDSVTASGTLIANAAYNGTTDKNLLAAGSTLAAAANFAISLTVDVGISGTTSFQNVATTTATTPAGSPVSDVSQDGADPDPDHDGDPGNNSTPTAIFLTVGVVTAPMLSLIAIASLILLMMGIGLLMRRRVTK